MPVVALFRDKSIITVFYLVILSVVVHTHLFFTTPLMVTSDQDGIFSLLLQTYLTGTGSSVLFILYQVIILVQAIRLNGVMMELRMFPSSNYTTAMAYILLTGLMPQWCSISPALLANFLLIWIFVKLSRLYNHPSPKTLLFNTGLIVGLSVVFYHPTAILIGVVLFALAVVRPFKLAEWLILLMGILVPYYFLASALFLKDRIAGFTHYLPYLKWNLPLDHWNLPLVQNLSVLTILLLVGLYYWQLSNKRMVIQIRKNWGVMMVMLLILLPIPFIFLHAGIESAIMCLIPMAAFDGNLFSNPRKLYLPNILCILSFIMIIYNNWSLIKN